VFHVQFFICNARISYTESPVTIIAKKRYKKEEKFKPSKARK
jgi:hypothetical protein